MRIISKKEEMALDDICKYLSGHTETSSNRLSACLHLV